MLLGVILTVLVAGCTGNGRSETKPVLPTASREQASSQETNQTGPVQITMPMGPARVTYPVDAYEFTDSQKAQISYLQAFLVHQCMSRLGFNFSSIKESAKQYYMAYVRDHEEADSREWGITDLVVAEKYGYELPPWTAGTRPPVALGSLPGPELHAMTGSAITKASSAESAPANPDIPQGGCLGQSLQELASAGILEDAANASLVAHISSQGFFKALSDSKVVNVFAKWSACMRANGYRYADPFAAAGSFASSTAVTKKQIRVAVTDIRCQRKVNELAVASAVDAGYQIQLIGQNLARLGQYKDRIAREVKELAGLMASYKIAVPALRGPRRSGRQAFRSSGTANASA